MLSVHLESVERLHACHIYPIVLLVTFKSAKQIREVKIPSSSSSAGSSSLLASSDETDFRMSQKDAKNIFEHTQKLEGEYRHLISGKLYYIIFTQRKQKFLMVHLLWTLKNYRQ